MLTENYLIEGILKACGSSLSGKDLDVPTNRVVKMTGKSERRNFAAEIYVCMFGIFSYVVMNICLFLPYYSTADRKSGTVSLIVNNASDFAFIPFPNSLFFLAYAVSDNLIESAIFVGAAWLVFLFYCRKFILTRKARLFVPYALAGYIVFSLIVFFPSVYWFFSCCFMR